MKPMPIIKLIVRELRVDGGKLWRATGIAGRLATLGLALLCGFPVAAQEPDASAQTNDAMAAEVLARLNDLVQAADSTQPEDMAPPSDLSATNDVPQAGSPASSGDRPNRFIRPDNSSRSDSGNRFQGSSRSQKDDRRSRGRRSFGSKSDQSGGYGSANDYSRGSDRSQTNSLADTNNGPVSLDYAAFKVIVDRNIFDPNRVPRRGSRPLREAPKSIDFLTLVGTMSYEKGTFAFFDGTSSEYKKVLKLADAIAGYKVTNIAPNGVKLTSGTNVLELGVGAQLRREENGPWLPAGQSTSYAAAPSSTSTNAAATTNGSDTTSGGAESDIIKRLMQKREKE